MSLSKQNVKIAIIGGGLGGVPAAITLGNLGYDVHIFEQASEFVEIGAGIAFAPNALRALKGMGLYEEYAQVATITDQKDPWFVFHTWDGKKITETYPSGPNSYVHRTRALDAFIKCLPPTVTPHFSSHITSVENTGNDTVLLSIAPPSAHFHPEWPGEQTTFEATVAIGCDGIKSVVREALRHPGKLNGGQVRYTGTYAYRGLLDLEEAVKVIGKSALVPRMWFADRKHVIAFPIEHGTIINIVAFVSDHSRPEDERTWTGPWVKPVPIETMLSDFEGWHRDVIELLKLIKNPERWALHEITPLDKWTVGRITLLGDAAHASLPHNGAGAGQAIEDVYVLSKLLALPECNADTIPRFLQAYDGARRERASRQLIYSRESGKVYEYASPMGDNLDALAENLPNRYDWIWVHDLDKDIDAAKEWLKAEGVIA